MSGPKTRGRTNPQRGGWVRQEKSKVPMQMGSMSLDAGPSITLDSLVPVLQVPVLSVDSPWYANLSSWEKEKKSQGHLKIFISKYDSNGNSGYTFKAI